jgi:pentatricopeptide repeat protein
MKSRDRAKSNDLHRKDLELEELDLSSVHEDPNFQGVPTAREVTAKSWSKTKQSSSITATAEGSHAEISAPAPTSRDPSHRPTKPDEIRTTGEIHPPDIDGFESALQTGDRVAAWLKFKDLCLSETHRSLLKTSHIEGVLSLLVQHRPPKYDFMRQTVKFAEQLNISLNISCYNYMIEAAIVKGDTDGAKQFLGEMTANEIAPNMDTYNLFLELYVREKNLDGAIAFFGRMIDEGVAPNIASFNALLKGATEANSLEMMNRFLGEMKDLEIRPDTKTWGILVYFYAVKCSNLDLAEKTLQQARESGGIQLSPIFATTLIKAFSDVNKVDRAIEIFDSAVKEGVTPDTIMYTAMINAHVKANQPHLAMDTFENMIASGCEPDYAAFQSIIEAFANAQEPQKAEEVLVAMKSREMPVSLSMYRTILYVYLDTGAVADGVRVFEQVKASGLSPTAGMYNRLLKGLAEDFDVELMARYWGRWKTAIKVQDARFAKGELSASQQSRRDRSGRVEIILEKPNAASYATVVEGYLACQSIDRAMYELKEMISLRYEPEPRIFIGMVEAYVRHRNYMAAAETMVMMRKSLSGKQGDVRKIVKDQSAQFEALVKGLLQESYEVETRPALTDDEIDSLESDRGGRNLVNRRLQDDAKAKAEAEGKRILGVELYREMIAAECKPNPDIFKMAIRAHHQAEDLVSAVKTWTTFRSCYPGPSPEPDVVATLLYCIQDIGKSQTGRAVIDMVQKESLKLNEAGYTAMLCIMAKFGWSDEVIGTVVDMVNDGIPLTPKITAPVLKTLRGAKNQEALKAVMEFFEENWPETIET